MLWFQSHTVQISLLLVGYLPCVYISKFISFREPCILILDAAPSPMALPEPGVGNHKPATVVPSQTELAQKDLYGNSGHESSGYSYYNNHHPVKKPKDAATAPSSKYHGAVSFDCYANAIHKSGSWQHSRTEWCAPSTK